MRKRFFSIAVIIPVFLGLNAIAMDGEVSSTPAIKGYTKEELETEFNKISKENADIKKIIEQYREQHHNKAEVEKINAEITETKKKEGDMRGLGIGFLMSAVGVIAAEKLGTYIGPMNSRMLQLAVTLFGLGFAIDNDALMVAARKVVLGSLSLQTAKFLDECKIFDNMPGLELAMRKMESYEKVVLATLFFNNVIYVPVYETFVRPHTDVLTTRAIRRLRG